MHIFAGAPTSLSRSSLNKVKNPFPSLGRARLTEEEKWTLLLTSLSFPDWNPRRHAFPSRLTEDLGDEADGVSPGAHVREGIFQSLFN